VTTLLQAGWNQLSVEYLEGRGVIQVERAREGTVDPEKECSGQVPGTEITRVLRDEANSPSADCEQESDKQGVRQHPAPPLPADPELDLQEFISVFRAKRDGGLPAFGRRSVDMRTAQHLQEQLY
jgi:hypothetical protein